MLGRGTCKPQETPQHVTATAAQKKMVETPRCYCGAVILLDTVAKVDIVGDSGVDDSWGGDSRGGDCCGRRIL